MGDRIEQSRLSLLALLHRFGLARTLERVLELIIQTLEFAFGSFGLFGSPLCPRRKVPGSQSSDQKSKEGHPIVRVANREGAERWQKKEIKAAHAQQGRKNRRARSPHGGDEKNDQQKSQRRSRRVDVRA